MASNQGANFKQCFLLKGNLQYRLDTKHKKNKFTVEAVDPSNASTIVFEIMAVGSDAFPDEVIQTIRGFFNEEKYRVKTCYLNSRAKGILLTVSVAALGDNEEHFAGKTASPLGSVASGFTLDTTNMVILGILGVLVVYLTARILSRAS